jgi:hypothetical protein
MDDDEDNDASDNESDHTHYSREPGSCMVFYMQARFHGIWDCFIKVEQEKIG